MVEKFVAIILLFIMVGGAFPLSPHSPSVTKVHCNSVPENDIIKIAILDSLIPSFTSPPEMEKILNGYSWSSGSTSYKFKTTFVTDLQVSAGVLKDYNLIVIPGIGKEFRRPMGNGPSQWKNEVRHFVSNGGGYFGTCGGANIASQGLLDAHERGWKHETAWEWFMNRSAIGIAPVKSYQDMGDPIACSLGGDPARIGQSAYVWYNLSIEGSGVCQHCRINTSHPIFHGYGKDTRIIRWVGGPALIPEGNVTVLAWYPDENISGPNGNESTNLHVWRYNVNPAEPFDLWDMESKLIETHLAGKLAAIACNYGKGKVVIFGNHPEHPVWKGGRIFEEDADNNHMFSKGLFHWKDRKMLPDSYNWWIVRRSAAWAAGLPASELPPITYDANSFS